MSGGLIGWIPSHTSLEGCVRASAALQPRAPEEGRPGNAQMVYKGADMP